MGVADGELLVRRRRCMQERGQVQCVRLLESRAEGEGRGTEGRLLSGGLEVVRCRGRGGAALLDFFLLSQTEFGSAHSFSLC